MASLQHLDGDRWRVRLFVPETGGQVSRSFRANGERAARRKVAEIEIELQRRAAAKVAYAGSFRSLIDEWLKESERELSPSTMIAYRRHAKLINKRFGKVAPEALTARDIERWFGELRDDGMNLATVHAVRRVFSAILRRAYRLEVIDRPVIDKVKITGHRAARKEPPTVEAFRRLVVALPDAEWANAVALAMWTGMRRGEIVGLRWEDVEGDDLWIRRAVLDRKGGGVIVRPWPKGKADRKVPIQGAAVVALRRQRARHTDAEWVFPASDGQPRRPDWLSLMWSRFREGVPGMEHVGLHGLRHFYATYLLDSGTPMAVVQELLGHADQSTTAIYAHSTDTGHARSRAALAALAETAE